MPMLINTSTYGERQLQDGASDCSQLQIKLTPQRTPRIWKNFDYLEFYVRFSHLSTGGQKVAHHALFHLTTVLPHAAPGKICFA
jgi:hypothetical protein